MDTIFIVIIYHNICMKTKKSSIKMFLISLDCAASDLTKMNYVTYEVKK